MNLIITQELAQTVVNYLLKQPYVEVADLVANLAKLEAAPTSVSAEEAINNNKDKQKTDK